MRLRDLMTRDLPSAAPDDTIGEAARKMVAGDVKALPVCAEGRLVGILTDWDVTRAVAASASPTTEPVARWMSEQPIAAPPDALLTDASELMAQYQIHHLPVVRDGMVEGMVHLDVDWNRLGEAGMPAPSFQSRI
ncbi:MAG: CBS domain-containing protein [Thermoleophilum sp.]|nr:CBS domain-containing protein [Thermoleophilum sp.]